MTVSKNKLLELNWETFINHYLAKMLNNIGLFYLGIVTSHFVGIC
jgi:hypothetical protein